MTEEQRDTIKKLKEHTGLTFFDCKKILAECEFDYDKAVLLSKDQHHRWDHKCVYVPPTNTGEKYKDDKYLIIFFFAGEFLNKTYTILDNKKLTPQGYDIDRINVFIHDEDLDAAVSNPVKIISSWYLRVLDKKECYKVNEYNESRELIKSYYEVGIVGNNVFMLDLDNKLYLENMKSYQYGLPFIDKGTTIKYRLANDLIMLDRRLCQMYIDCKMDESKLKQKLNLKNAFSIIDLYSRLFILILSLYDDPNNTEFTGKL